MEKKEFSVRSRTSIFIIFSLFALFFFGGGFLIGRDYRKITPGVPLKFDKVIDVYQKLSKEFIFKDKINPEQLEYGAAKGLIDAAGDPYTYFLTPKETKDFEEIINGSFDGIGAEIGLNKDRQLIVIAPLEGTPAKKSGLMPQDIILQINDKLTTGLTLDEALSLIRGPQGSSVTLNIKRSTLLEPVKISIVREVIEIPTIHWKLLQGNKIAYIQIFNFYEKAENDFRDVAQKLLTSGAASIIIDLRGNPGGILQKAVDIGGWFIDKNAVVVSEKSAGGALSEYLSEGPTKLKGFPLIILIDRGSASASEILAGALKHYNNATLVGEKTFGKGTAQIVDKFPDGSALHVTVSRWLLPSGKSIDKEGITPDVLVARKGANNNEDTQLQKAIELLK